MNKHTKISFNPIQKGTSDFQEGRDPSVLSYESDKNDHFAFEEMKNSDASNIK